MIKIALFFLKEVCVASAESEGRTGWLIFLARNGNRDFIGRNLVFWPWDYLVCSLVSLLTSLQVLSPSSVHTSQLFTTRSTHITQSLTVIGIGRTLNYRRTCPLIRPSDQKTNINGGFLRKRYLTRCTRQAILKPLF